LTKAEYAKYLRSGTWKAKRAEALLAAGHHCQICNRDKRLHVHHRTYDRVGGQELLADLTVLCEACHNLFHQNGRTVKSEGRNGNTAKGLAFKERQVKANRKAAQTVAEADEAQWRSWEQMLHELPRNGAGAFATGSFHQHSGLSLNQSRQVLRKLAGDGFIKQISKKRWMFAQDSPRAEERELERALDRLLEAPEHRGLPQRAATGR
jgi:ribosomal protein S25